LNNGAFSPRTPKLDVSGAAGRAHWYPYYAGYSAAFVEDMLRFLQLDGAQRPVLDPWNGSGTTTAVCSQKAIPSTGFDLNPAMAVVAKARLLDINTAKSLPPLLQAIFREAAEFSAAALPVDALDTWFMPATARHIRSVSLAIERLLAPRVDSQIEIEDISSIAAFFYVLLFRAARRLTRVHATTNPTWMSTTIEPKARVSVTRRALFDQLHSDLNSIRLLEEPIPPKRFAVASIATADSCSLPVDSASVGAVISSPPYCTRIDYAVATRLELAVLGVADSAADGLRRRMLGTTAIGPHRLEHARYDLPPSISDLLGQIANTGAKASVSYYEPVFRDYFNKYALSIAEIDRVAAPGSPVALVVQDSYHRDVHIDLAKCTRDLMARHGFDLCDEWRFPINKTMRDRRKATRRAQLPVESALLFKKEKRRA
jgi:hypothetical protein